MSRDCVDALWKAQIKPATLKLTLMAICDRADNDGYRCYPSIERVCKDTSLNKKTVQANINKLIKMGLIYDTGKRVGSTQRVKVLKVNLGCIQKWNDTENGVNNAPENGVNNDPENGTQNQSLNQPLNQPDKIVSPDGLTKPDIQEHMQKGFYYFWQTWKDCKKRMEAKNNSTMKKSRERWDRYFNAAWWKDNTLDDYDSMVNSICNYAEEIHQADQTGFCPARQMMTDKFFSGEGWKSE